MYFVFKSDYINYLNHGKQNDKKIKREIPTKLAGFSLETGFQGRAQHPPPRLSGLSFSVTVRGWGPTFCLLTPTRRTHCERWNTPSPLSLVALASLLQGFVISTYGVLAPWTCLPAVHSSGALQERPVTWGPGYFPRGDVE